MFYGNADGFLTYLNERGREVSDDWDTADINAALLVASEWLDNQYETSWIGYKKDFEQERSWPRQNAVVPTYPYHVFSTTDIPVQVVCATYEAAQRELTNKGSLQIDYKPSVYKSVSVHNAVIVEYNDTVTSAYDVQTQITVIQNLMSSLIDPQKGVDNNPLCGKLVRV